MAEAHTTGHALSDQEIVECLASFNCPINVESLRKPTKVFILDVFTNFMQALEINVDAMRVMPFDADQHLDHVELYEGIMPLMRFSNTVQNLITHAGITDFGISDILDPKPKRTKKILNHLIFLWKHVLEKKQSEKEILSKVQSRNEKRDVLISQRDSLKEKLAELAALKPSQDAKDELKEKFAANRSKLDKLVKVSKDKTASYQTLKMDISKLQVNNSELDVKILDHKKQLAEISSKIVKSPTRHKTELDQLQKKEREVNSKLVEALKTKELKKQELEEYQSRAKVFKETYTTLIDIIGNLDIFKNDVSSFNAKQQLIKAVSEKLKAVEDRIAEVEKKKRLLEQKTVQRHLQKKSELECMRQIEATQAKTLEKEERMIQTLEAQLRTAQAEEAALKRKVNDAKVKHERTMLDLKIQCKKIHDKIKREYEQREAKVLKATRVLEQNKEK